MPRMQVGHASSSHSSTNNNCMRPCVWSLADATAAAAEAAKVACSASLAAGGAASSSSSSAASTSKQPESTRVLDAVRSSLNCAICWSMAVVPIVIGTQGCGHVFCKHCLNRMMATQGRRQCPTCRRSFNASHLQPLLESSQVLRSLAAEITAECDECHLTMPYTKLGDHCGRECGNCHNLVPACQAKAHFGLQ